MNQPLYGIWLGDVFFCFSGETSEPRIDAWSSVIRRLTLKGDLRPFRQAALRLAEVRIPNNARVETAGRGGKRRSMLGRTLEGLALEPRETMALLTRMDEKGCAASGITLGEEMQYWQKAAYFALELMQRGEIVPSLTEARPSGPRRRGPDAAVGVWIPRLREEEDIRRFHELAAAMPAVCMAAPAVFAGKEPETREDAAGMVLYSFLCAVVHAETTAVLAASDRELGRYRADYRRGGSPLAELWWNSLLTGSRQVAIQGTPAEMEELVLQASSLEGSTMPVTEREAKEPIEGQLRLCLRLEPSLEESIQEWRITFWAESDAEPGLRLPALALWAYPERDLVRGEIVYRQVQAQLLTRLGQAAEAAPILQEALNRPYPEGLTLEPEMFFRFLTEAVPSLQKNGITVQMPSRWSREGRRRAGLRLKMRSTEQGTKPDGVIADTSSVGINRMISFDAEAVLGDTALTMEELESIVAANLPYVRLGGEWIEVDPKEIRQVLRFIKRGENGEMSLSEWMHLAAENESAGEASWKGLSIFGAESAGLLASLAEGGVLRSVEPRPVPETLHGALRAYQERGFQWLAAMRGLGFGVCLADDMGLGKTIQVITCLLDGGIGAEDQRPALIICPTSLLGNWQRELKRFSPDLSLYIHHGNQRLHGEQFQENVREYDIVLTTYHLAGRDGSDLSAVYWSSIVLDEAQYIKNARTKQAQSVMKLSAPHRIAMTGTPVENRLSELWSIFQFLNPGYLGTASSFRQRYSLAGEERGSALRELHRLVSPFMLRRLKSDPDIRKDLPEKLELKSYCVLTPEQAGLYRGVVDQLLGTLDGQVGMARKGLVLSSLTKLKQICDHPGLIIPGRADSSKAENSGKMERLLELVETIRENDESALIFTQYVSMGELLVSRLAKILGEEPYFLHGGLAKTRRDEMVHNFQQGKGPNIFVLSLRAGGVGLNLTRASHVIHYDRWWNPAVENQATDRVFRIGQSRNVQVHKLICQGTLEERIDELIESKKALSEQVVGSGEHWLTEMSDDELRGLIALQNDVWIE
ncbi:DEAD/DEAH box helicase [Paenibacillus polymyxa]|uniref:DEAD/DEAH box helicase n=1 Tax=Paenibacillus polymyxa TaxID=1406 RepID=UPI000C9EEF9A|nr:DEAD/DEAH box helicase [Paenibacillus polymyxa]AUS24775.1 DNA helicase [Paenibacillus polymyxa]